jgi:hypothetical protein
MGLSVRTAHRKSSIDATAFASSRVLSLCGRENNVG